MSVRTTLISMLKEVHKLQPFFFFVFFFLLAFLEMDDPNRFALFLQEAGVRYFQRSALDFLRKEEKAIWQKLSNGEYF